MRGQLDLDVYYRIQLCALVNTAMNVEVSHTKGNVLTN